MSIGVQSYPELYTTLLGFGLYGKLWELLTQTGIAYIPFLGLILRNITRSYVDNGSRDAGPVALRSMEVNLIVSIFLILFAVAPCIPFDARTISYTPVCTSQKDQTFFPGDTGTTYDKAFTLPVNEVRLPMWWYLVISVSEGITHAANTMVGCVPNLRKMVTEVNVAQISDPEVKQELKDFESMCYIPARVMFNQDKRNNKSTNIDRIQKNTKEYGIEDTEWLGSHGFTDVYYKNLKSTRAITGFYYDAAEDINADAVKANPPVYGTPTCSKWWNDKEHGLKNRVFKSLPDNFYTDFKNYIHGAKNQDDVVKRIIANDTNGYDNANTTMSEYGLSHAATALGVLYHQIEEYPKIYAVSQAAPIIQALLLLMIYVFLPFMLVFSGYKAGTFVTGAILIFSVIFWGFIWHLVSWTDNALMQALYTNWFTRQGAGATLADMIIASLVIFSPLFWFLFMNSMGIVAGDIVSGMVSGSSGISDSAAHKGVQTLKAGAKTATAKATTK